MPHTTSSLQQPANAQWRQAVPFLLFFAIVNVWSWQLPFFWDGILYGRKAIYFQDSGFAQLAVPAGLDAGHPPFFGLYLALVWEVLGRSLWASHLAMLPLVLGVVWQMWLLVRRFVPPQGWLIGMLLLSLDPTWLSYATTVSNDVMLVFAYLLAVNAMLKQNRILLTVALLILAASSLRGIVSVGGIGLSELLFLFIFRDRKFNFKLVWPYVVTGIAVLAWLVYHYQKTGWLVSTPAEGWVAQRQIVGVAGMARNAVIIAWRLLDFGRIVVWAIALFCFVQLLRNNFKNWTPALQLLVLACAPLAIYSAMFLPYSNSISHRYVLVCSLLFTVLAAWLMAHYLQGKKRYVLTAVAALALLSGHFWIYPDPMAKGWDSHLAHLPYFELRKEAIAYISEQKIDPARIGTYFPNEHGTQYTDLDGSNWKFNFKDLSRDEFILESNVFNTPRADLQELQSDKWKLVKQWKGGGVKIRLYQRSNYEPVEEVVAVANK